MSPVNFRKFLVNRLRDIQFLSSSDESVRFLCVFSVYLVTLSGYGIRGYIYYCDMSVIRIGLYLRLSTVVTRRSLRRSYGHDISNTF
jgi:hypothetical protein